MKKTVRNKILNVADFLEIIIGVLLAISIAISVVFLASNLKLVMLNTTDLEAFDNFLATAFNLVIGIEFIKMLCKHSPETVIEVLLFALARQLIVEHTNTMENLIGIISIAILFGVRKYLFNSFDEIDKTIYRGNERVKRINILEHIDIPHEHHDTLEDVILKEIEKRKLTMGTGLCIYYCDFALKIAKVKNNQITRVEVIRSVNHN